MLTIKRQVTAGSQLTSEKTNLRVLTTVDSLDYQVVGFEFAINNGEAFNREATTVYRSVASHEGGQVVANNPDKLFSSESTHFLSWEFYNIPQSDFGSTIQVTPYWQTADGAKVMGKTREFTIAEAIEAEAA